MQNAVPARLQTENDAACRQVSHLLGLLDLFVKMLNAGDQPAILRLAADSVSNLGPVHAEAAYLDGEDGLVGQLTPRPAIERQVNALNGAPGSITSRKHPWTWAYPLNDKGLTYGYLVLGAGRAPSPGTMLLLDVLLRQTSAALANASRHDGARRTANDGRAHNSKHALTNDELGRKVADLEMQANAYKVLSSVSASGGGANGLAVALYELTGRAAAVEDRFGNLLAWSGPDQPKPYPKPDDQQRGELLRRAASERRPIRHGNRLIALVQPKNEILGLVAIVQHQHTFDHDDSFVLQYAATLLAMEMAHRRSLAEVELRLRRELVEDVLSDQADDSTYARAAAIGYDLHQPHHVVAISWQQPAGRTELSDAVAAAAKVLDLVPLQARRSKAVVLLVPARVAGEELYHAVSQEIGPAGAIGVGGRCSELGDFPRSLRQSLKALEIRRTSQQPYGVTAFDQLGLYRILGTGRGSEDVSEFVQQWIGQLVDYDRRRHTSLVETLSQYLECGGNYDHAAQALLIHRSTLRYRLRRIREVSGLDLTDVDCRLNLHVATRAWRVLDDMV